MDVTFLDLTLTAEIDGAKTRFAWASPITAANRSAVKRQLDAAAAELVAARGLKIIKREYDEFVLHYPAKEQ